MLRWNDRSAVKRIKQNDIKVSLVVGMKVSAVIGMKMKMKMKLLEVTFPL